MEKGKKWLAYGGGGAGLVLLVSLFVHFWPLIVGFFTGTGNPPVVIVGGCIHGKFDYTNTTTSGLWKSISDGVEYSAAVPEKTTLHFVNVYGQSTGQQVNQVIVGTAWVINFVDRQNDGITPQGSPGIQLCSDQTCTGKSDSEEIVYFQAAQHIGAQKLDTGLEYVKSANELHFHSYSRGCKDQIGSGSEDENCDYLYKFTIPNVSNETYVCGGSANPTGKCEIHVGK